MTSRQATVAATVDDMQVPIFVGEGRLDYRRKPLPHIEQDDDVVVEMEACGICGTDLNIMATPPAHLATPGIVIGHEGVGRVHQVGPAVDDLHSGDRVAIAPRLTCGRCPYCRRGLDNQCTDYETIGTTRDGAFAPYLLAPRRALYPIDATVPLEDALFFEPLSCVVGAIDRASFRPGDRVLIIGAGPMGMLFALLYRHCGAGQIIIADLAPNRLHLARSLQLGSVIDLRTENLPEQVSQLTEIGADLAIDAVGNQIEQAAVSVRRGGQIILFGLRKTDRPQISQYQLTRSDITVHGVFVGLHPFEQTRALLHSGRFHPSVLITHRVPLEQLPHGLDLMRHGTALKVIVDFKQHETTYKE